MWVPKKFQFQTLFITCNEDHIVWQEGVLNRRDLKLYYRDMISVSGADGAKYLGGTSRFEINTAGQTYSYNSTLGGFNGIENCIDIINERIQFVKTRDEENHKQLDIEKERIIAEAVAKAMQEQSIDTSNNVNQITGVNINPNNVEPTVTRIELFLEEKDWDRAKAYAETALDYFPTDYRLYLFLLCVDMKVASFDELANSTVSIDENSNYKKAMRFADDEAKERIETLSQTIKNRIAEKEEADIIAADKLAATRSELIKHVRIMLGVDPDPACVEILSDEEKRYAEVIKRLQEQLAIEEKKETPLLVASDEEKRKKLELESARFDNEMASIENEIERLKEELSSLGIFSVGKKKEINARIEGLIAQEPLVREKHSENVETINAEVRNQQDAICEGTVGIKKLIDEELQLHNARITEIKDHQFVFGHHIKETNSDPEPIEWILLEKNRSSALIISKYALDFKPYNTTRKSVIWGDCSLRSWLNGEFLTKSFTEEEQSILLFNKTEPRNTIMDKVFLLSVNDAKKYFTDDNSRRCQKMPSKLSKESECSWWLRTPGVDSQTFVAVVNSLGGILTKGVPVDAQNRAVRPVIRLSLE